MSALAALALLPLVTLAEPTADERTLTVLLAQAAATAPDAEVVTSRDVTQLLELEGERQSLGCNDSSEACAAELASALGAELLVRGELSTLDGERTLAVTVLHTQELGRTRRALWRSKTVSGLGDQVAAHLPALVAAARSPGHARIFVVDVSTPPPGGADPATHGADAPLAWQWWAGGGLLGVGAAALVTAGIAEGVVASWQGKLDERGSARLDQPAAVALGADRDRLALAGQLAWGVSAVGVVGGALVLSTLLWGE